MIIELFARITLVRLSIPLIAKQTNHGHLEIRFHEHHQHIANSSHSGYCQSVSCVLNVLFSDLSLHVLFSPKQRIQECILLTSSPIFRVMAGS